MLYKGLFKRVVPFMLTFAAGLFIASFFITIAAPNLNLRSNRSSHKMRELHRLRIENRELREQNARIKAELEARRRESVTFENILPLVPEVTADAPAPPPPPRAPRHFRDR